MMEDPEIVRLQMKFEALRQEMHDHTEESEARISKLENANEEFQKRFRFGTGIVFGIIITLGTLGYHASDKVGRFITNALKLGM